MPMDPKSNELCDGESEFGWGKGMFPPGIADTSGPDFGEDYPDTIAPQPNTRARDNYARAVADRRTDPTDSQSNRDFTTYGNPDRYGPNPALIQAEPPKKKRTKDLGKVGYPPLQRKP